MKEHVISVFGWCIWCGFNYWPHVRDYWEISAHTPFIFAAISHSLLFIFSLLCFQETQNHKKYMTEISALNQDTAPHSATGFIKRVSVFGLLPILLFN